ncbi:MAG: hypothetical protein V4579_11260 [Pseudomonadota bacterium]
MFLSKKANAWSPATGINSALSYGQNVRGLKLEDQEKTAVAQIMDAEARALRAKGMTDDQIDYDGLFLRATRNVATVDKGVIWNSDGSKPLYQMTEGSIPDAWRKQAEASFKREMGRKPSDDELLTLFRSTYRFRDAN